MFVASVASGSITGAVSVLILPTTEVFIIEFVAYDSADRARSFTMNQLTYSESPTNIDIFLSEFAYGITINSYRLIRPYVEHYIKNGIKNISDLFVEAQQEYKYCIDDLLYSILDLNYDDISTADWNY